MLDIPGWIPLHRLAAVATLLVAVVALTLADRPSRLATALRRRFLFGLPWGTLVSVGGVLFVYLFVQDGLSSWYRPMVIPFRAWSYFYPLGMATAAFSHSGAGHLIGNLIGTLTLAPVAEYAWGHYPTRRGSTSFGSLRENPYVRAFIIFPGVVFGVGLLTSVFALGPVIGFSGVVFAFAGFALVTRPLTTVLAFVSGRVVRVFYNAMLSPEVVSTARPVFSTPRWAQIAIQGHAIGLLFGILLGLWVARQRRDEQLSAFRSFAGVLLFAISESLWAVYFFRGGGTYVLFRAVGFALVVLLALLVALTVSASDKPLRERAPTGHAFSARRWQVGAVVLLLVVSALSGPAVLYNLFTATNDDLPGESVSVEDYEVTYAEDVPNGLTAAFDIELFGESTTTNTSGVIVKSQRRGIWTTAVSKNRLAFDGETAVRLGGLGWRDRVTAVRDGYAVVGSGNTAYRVFLVDDGNTTLAYKTEPVRAGPVISRRNISVVPTAMGYDLQVSSESGTVRGPMPTTNVSTTLGGIRFVRQGRSIFAESRGTRVRVARQESYE
ncbi:rhomboid family intramembrane serine protease [Haloferax mediterranei ATCC 33500]|uniref:Membrane protein n=1 Tax=Haloferax mediterranei (strain ATCC 33500 / DSM 1411 / JCM 8866 / NBRC 14739 / NCIMB 2177 / R-4) TaxID=523841 RepID=I3R4T5_HALMT|nr:rhomboid family intramembrane serine protease [Haloferax mediterranei]AFK19245.1 rhomboid family protein/intramembrane serine protease [Haloferax mediterranei ATCC 33500]AHZ21396.1 membrane protein [Haloferax mediterranei ATCC 33500]EMA04567.1 rhomboid family protein/intramembrane serine protease [Haloferax mediterranei ATCC 33500]MDX5989347.1 rhomboid family intramembrane serine protease [Haloferax mediterranei ATCC 33500]QCQ75712.1 rhomboid family intramembrane serine protease [Haloferax 